MAAPLGLPAAGYALFLVVGLLGGAHCLGMCGPLVTVYASRLADGGGQHGGPPDRVTWTAVRQHALFNLGRTASYAAVGALMGAAGALLVDAGGVVAAAEGVRAVVGVAVGLAILAVGVRYLVGGTAGAGHVPMLDGLFGRVSGALTARVDDWVRGPRIAALGALHGAMPCPLLYPAFLWALARGDPLAGAAALGTLGLGTVPSLFAYGTLFGSLSASSRVRLHRALGAVFLVLGTVPLANGLAAAGVPVPRLPLPAYQPL